MTSEALLETDVRLAMDGDHDAYGRLVEQSANVVCAIALAIVRNVKASEDVAQEVFLAAWTSRGKLRNPSSFLPWLRQVTRNQANLWLRAHTRERSDDDALAAAVDARPSPADALLLDEEKRVLAGVMAELTDDAREVVILYYREGSSARHVADLLGISEDAVKQRLSRARAKIRAEMLQRFGGTLARTAPGAAFVTAVGVALTAAAPPASAAIAMSAGAKAGGGVSLLLLLKSIIPGVLAGAAGVAMSFTHIGDPWDEREAEDLRRFKRLAMVVVLIANVIFAATVFWLPNRWMILAVFVAYFGAILYLYAVRLRRILAHRGEESSFLEIVTPALSGATLMLSLYFFLKR